MAAMPPKGPDSDKPKVCNHSCENRITRVKDLTDFYCRQFSSERYFSMIFSSIGVILMIVCTVFVLFRSKLDTTSIAILSGSILGGSGFMTLGIAQLFRFMDKVNDEVSENL